MFRSANRRAYRYALIAFSSFFLSLVLLSLRFLSSDNPIFDVEKEPANLVSISLICICAGFAWLTYSSLQKCSLAVDPERIEGFLVSYGSPIDLPIREDNDDLNPTRWASCRWKDITEVKLSAHRLEVTDRFESQYIFAISHLSRDEYSALDETLNFYLQKTKTT